MRVPRQTDRGKGSKSTRNGSGRDTRLLKSAFAKRAYVRPWDTAENYIKREAYLLISNYLETSGGRQTIKKIVKPLGQPKEPTFAANPFYWGLLAIELFDQDKKPELKISLYAPLLLYAHLHKVPAAYLTGFLMQVGRPVDVDSKSDPEKLRPSSTKCVRAGL